MSIDKIKLSGLLASLDNKVLDFQGVLTFIDSYYAYTPTHFSNGVLYNAPQENEGSCKVFGFAKHNQLSQTDTLKLFAEHYEKVKTTPNDSDHANIRNFMFYGWQGFLMEQNCLTLKNS